MSSWPDFDKFDIIAGQGTGKVTMVPRQTGNLAFNVVITSEDGEWSYGMVANVKQKYSLIPSEKYMARADEQNILITWDGPTDGTGSGANRWLVDKSLIIRQQSVDMLRVDVPRYGIYNITYYYMNEEHTLEIDARLAPLDPGGPIPAPGDGGINIIEKPGLEGPGGTGGN